VENFDPVLMKLEDIHHMLLNLTGVAVAIVVTLAYIVINYFFEALGDVNYLPAMLAAWASDMLFGLVGSYLLLKTPT